MISSNLLPHQKKRLKELRIRRDFEALNTPSYQGMALKKLLDLTDEQLKQLIDKSPDFQKTLSTELASLAEKRKFEFLAKNLTRKQLRLLQKNDWRKT